MADTLATIRNRVKLKVGNKSGIDSTIDENINEAILQVIQEAMPQEMWATTTFSTSSGTASYAFTGAAINKTDIYNIKFVRDNTDDVPLRHGSYEEWNNYSQQTTTYGDPRVWVREGNNLILFSSIPDSTSRTIKITYLKRPTRLSADSDTFPLNDEWKRPVEELAAAYTFVDLNATDKAAMKFQTYDNLLARRTSPEGEEDASPYGSAFMPIHNLSLQD